MRLQKLIRTIFFQNSVFLESGWRFRFCHLAAFQQAARSSSAFPDTSVTLEENATKRKIIKVAILGRPNAGKSTLINRILNKTICDVSCKTHTTRMPLKTALTVGDTQIVFVDTPGIVTKQEYRRFDLSETFLEWKKRVFSEADIVGVIHDAQRIHETHNFSTKLINCIHELPETMPMFLIINKIDLVKDKEKLIKASERLLAVKKSRKVVDDSETSGSEDLNQESKKNSMSEKLNFKKRFSKIFFISALQNTGVGEVVTYLLEQAKEGEWMLPADKHLDAPLHKVILNLIRAELMDFLPHDLPYSLKFQIELLEENDLGQIACVALVKCPKSSKKAFILSRKLNRIKNIARKLESDLYNIFQKEFKLTIVIADKMGNV